MPTTATPRRLEVQHPAGEKPTHDQDEGSGDARRDPSEPEDDDQGDGAHNQRRATRLGQAAEPRAQLLERVVAADVGAGELGELTDDDVDRRAEQEAGHHCTREELGDPPHPEHGEEHEQQSGDQRDACDEGRYVVFAGDPGSQDGSSGNRGQPRAGPHGDLAAGAEDRVEDRPGGSGVQTVLERDSRDACIAEVLGDDERRDDHPGDQVAAKPLALIGADPVRNRHQASVHPVLAPARSLDATTETMDGLPQAEPSSGRHRDACRPNATRPGQAFDWDAPPSVSVLISGLGRSSRWAAALGAVSACTPLTSRDRQTLTT